MEKNKIEGLIEQDSMKLVKYAKGYGYEIKIHGEEIAGMLTKIKESNDKMKEIIGEPEWIWKE